jgi:SAM-dependent methyltransferase
MLENQGYSTITGVDLCAEELQQARPFIRATLECSEVMTFLQATPSESLDFITALNFFEHVTKDQLRSILTECRRVLRPGGVVVAMVPNAISPFGGLTRHWDYTHEWAFVPNNFRQLGHVAGFSSHLDFRECGPSPHGLVSILRYLAWQVLRGMIAGWLLVEVADTKGGVYTMDMLVRLRA